MSSPFVAEIRIFGCNFAPTGWALCNGQLMPISQNTALFSLVGTFYGGDGKSTFALPDLQGNVPINQGQSTTGTQFFVGEESGSQNVTLLQTEIPVHTHTVMASNQQGDVQQATATTSLARPVGATPYVLGNTNPPNSAMAFQSLSPAGSSFPHNNMMPFLTLNFCIALQGVFPPRSSPTPGAPTKGRKAASGASTPIAIIRDE
ncbi:MAG: phage tail protein [Pyrinomonadaceae bacterium]